MLTVSLVTFDELDDERFVQFEVGTSRKGAWSDLAPESRAGFALNESSWKLGAISALAC